MTMSPRITTAYDVAELLRSIAIARSIGDHDIEEIERPWLGAHTIEWVEHWRQTSGYWRRGNPYRYHRWGEDV